MRNLVLLDVDGVLNALGPAGPEWSDWQHGQASALGRSWPIRWSPTVLAAVRSWAPRAEVQWLTTWGRQANCGLHDLLGLPELPVAGTPEDPSAGATDPDADALAAVTPAAPDELTGRWWKFDVVRRLVREQPGRRLVWLDDDLGADDGVRAWTRAHCDCLLISPHPRQGLIRAHLDAVDRFLGQVN